MSSNVEDILSSMVNGTEYTKQPGSRVEELLLQLKESIGGGSSSGSSAWTKTVSAASGASNVTINDSNIHTTSIVEPYSQNSSGTVIASKTIVVSEGSAVITFSEALKEATSFRLHIINL
jgi:hypothetical protein